MVLIDELVKEFYDRIKDQHVLVLASLDVDSVCACKILQTLFKADNTKYTLVPVTGIRQLQDAIADHTGQVQTIVLINCGGGLNLLELLEPSTTIQFYIIDSYRPLELDNVYTQDHVNVVVYESEQLEFPQFDDIYASDMDSEDEEDPEEYHSYSEGEEEERGDVSPSSKRRRKTKGRSFEARKRRHLWKKKREDILFKYKEFSYHGTAASIIMYQLALRMSRDSNQVLWWAIIGLTEQYLYEKIDRERYVEHVHYLQPHVLRLNRRDEDSSISVNSLKIEFENELRIVLYRHWTLYDSLCHSDYVSCRFKTWTMKGHKKFLEFLADMGLPLAQSRQVYTAMEVSVKDNVKDWIMSSASRFGMDDLTYSSFVLQVGYRHHFCAADMVYCLTALLENNAGSNFLSALDALNKDNLQKVQEGIELAKQQQIAIVNQVRSFTDMHQVTCAGPFFYAYVEETAANNKCFNGPITLKRLTRYLRETWSTATSKKARDLPFIVSSPPNDSGMCLSVGIPPRADDSHRSEFHNAFAVAAKRVDARTDFNHFDGSVMIIQADDRSKFFDALSALSLL